MNLESFLKWIPQNEEELELFEQIFSFGTRNLDEHDRWSDEYIKILSKELINKDKYYHIYIIKEYLETPDWQTRIEEFYNEFTRLYDFSRRDDIQEMINSIPK